MVFNYNELKKEFKLEKKRLKIKQIEEKNEDIMQNEAYIKRTRMENPHTREELIEIYKKEIIKKDKELEGYYPGDIIDTIAPMTESKFHLIRGIMNIIDDFFEKFFHTYARAEAEERMYQKYTEEELDELERLRLEEIKNGGNYEERLENWANEIGETEHSAKAKKYVKRKLRNASIKKHIIKSPIYIINIVARFIIIIAIVIIVAYYLITDHITDSILQELFKHTGPH